MVSYRIPTYHLRILGKRVMCHWGPDKNAYMSSHSVLSDWSLLFSTMLFPLFAICKNCVTFSPDFFSKNDLRSCKFILIIDTEMSQCVLFSENELKMFYFHVLPSISTSKEDEDKKQTKQFCHFLRQVSVFRAWLDFFKNKHIQLKEDN